MKRYNTGLAVQNDLSSVCQSACSIGRIPCCIPGILMLPHMSVGISKICQKQFFRPSIASKTTRTMLWFKLVKYIIRMELFRLVIILLKKFILECWDLTLGNLVMHSDFSCKCNDDMWHNSVGLEKEDSLIWSYLSLCLYLTSFLFLYASIYPSICPFVCLCVSLAVYTSVCLSNLSSIWFFFLHVRMCSTCFGCQK
jgi:hypothetical protein